MNAGNKGDSSAVFTEDKERRIWMAGSEGLIVLNPGGISENADQGESRRAVVREGAINAGGQAELPAAPNEAFVFSFADLFLREQGKMSRADNLKPLIYAIICASDGKIWLATNYGLVVFDGEKFQHYTTAQGLGTDIISNILEDNEKHIWLGTYGGLHRINPKGLTTFDKLGGLENARIHSIYENKTGVLFVVSGNFNISRFDSGGTFTMTRPRLPADSLTFWQSNVAFHDSRGDWWVNTQNALYRYTGVRRIEDLNDKPPTDVYDETNGLLSGSNQRVFEDSNGDIWFSTRGGSKRNGLTRWHRATGEFQHFLMEDGLPELSRIVAFAEDGAGNFWFGFAYSGIVRRDKDGRFVLLDEPGIPKGGITDIFRDKSGRFWLATSREGLIRVDDPEAEHPTFRRYTIADGLTSNNVRCITEDLDGNIYVGTVRGVNRLSPETGYVKYYGTSDGLASDFISTAWRDRHGAIWFGTFNGLSKLVPEPDLPSPPPPILISGLRIDGEEYSVSALGQKEAFVPEQNASRNNIQIDFFSVSTGNASTRYQYRLDGADSGWSQPTVERSVTFANLSPGGYGFLVRAVNAEGAASENPARVTFSIARPVWQRWWFLLFAAVVIFGSIYALYRYRLKRLLELEKVRTRIATDLHDDIGASLSKIAILSEIVGHRIAPVAPDQSEITEPLESIAGTSREMVDSMSDIVWAINPAKDHLSDLIGRMRNLAGEMTELRDIRLKINLENVENSDLTVGADLRREIYLIFKECLNNLVKHSAGDTAEIEFRLAGENLFVSVTDNGRGFDANVKNNGTENRGGNGLPNMKRRAANLGGSFEIRSETGKGTTAVLRVPVKRGRFNLKEIFRNGK